MALAMPVLNPVVVWVALAMPVLNPVVVLGGTGYASAEPGGCLGGTGYASAEPGSRFPPACSFPQASHSPVVSGYALCGSPRSFTVRVGMPILQNREDSP